MTYWPRPFGWTVVIMANSGRLAHLAAWACEVWSRRRWDLCALLCWQLLLAQFGVVCLLVRALVVALRPARDGRGWWRRLALADAAELVLDALGLPGSVLAHWAVLVVWLHRKAAVHRKGVLHQRGALRRAGA